MGNTYTHRFNSDGTVDSICHSCFQTVAMARREAELEGIERDHVCDPEERQFIDEARKPELEPANPG